MVVVGVLGLLACVVNGDAVPLNTTVGMFGPLSVFQPFENWLYPPNTAIPLSISLGNSSLALYLLPVPQYLSSLLLLPEPSVPSIHVCKLTSSTFGFQLTYGISSTSDPQTYIQMDSATVPQYTQMFNFTGNLLSNQFWWNTSVDGMQDGNYILTTSASFFACSDGSADCIIPTRPYLFHLFLIPLLFSKLMPRVLDLPSLPYFPIYSAIILPLRTCPDVTNI